MAIFITGLLLFFGVHLIPNIGDTRARLVDTLGEKAYVPVYAILSVIGMVMLSMGRGDAGYIHVWAPPIWTRHVTMPIMLIALYFFVSIFVSSNLKYKFKHPMLFAVGLWGLGHLCTNGDLVSILFFGSFTLFSFFKVFSLNRRKPQEQGEKPAWSKDVVALIIAGVAYVAIVWGHEYLSGVPLLGNL